MIYTDKTDLAPYYGISPNMDHAFDYIKTHDLLALPLGRNEVDGDAVFINRMNYNTMEETKAFFEAHEQYVDIHVLLSGKEQIGVTDIAHMAETDRDVNTDFIGYEGKTEAYCHMEPGKVLVAFPRDAHKVKIKVAESELVEKVVIKVKLEQEV